jgi:hypothetical protein
MKFMDIFITSAGDASTRDRRQHRRRRSAPEKRRSVEENEVAEEAEGAFIR